jgi:tetratricopeptide (TPR) repeat protein
VTGDAAFGGDHPTYLRHAVELCLAGRPEEARLLCAAILQQAPSHAGALHLLGMLALSAGAGAEALGLLRQAADLDPENPELLNNLGGALQSLNRLGEAIPWHRAALERAPDMVGAQMNLALALDALDRHGEAEAGFRRVTQLQPDHAHAWTRLAGTLLQQNRAQEAIACYRRALALDPRSQQAELNLMVALLTAGDFARAWPAYEARWRLKPDLRQSAAATRAPLWLGEPDIAGSTILLHAEQGLGDAIQFARYAPRVAARGARVMLEVLPGLRPLFLGMKGLAAVFERGDDLPDFAWQCPLMSLPLVFRTDLGTIPATIPYVAADRVRIAAWQRRLGPRTRPRIGLAWSGSLEHPNDAYRSIALARLAPIVVRGEFSFHCLQKSIRAADAETAAGLPGVGLHEAALTDWGETAALLSLMDLVIAVDTSVAHLAGALGRPCWLLLPFRADWRWLLHRADSPWYPGMRLLRQQAPGDWDGVMDEVGRALAALSTSN